MNVSEFETASPSDLNENGGYLPCLTQEYLDSPFPNHGMTRYVHEGLFNGAELVESYYYTCHMSGALLRAASGGNAHIMWERCDSSDIHERLSEPTKVEPLFGGIVSERAAMYNKPRHFGMTALAVMEAYERDASESDDQ